MLVYARDLGSVVTIRYQLPYPEYQQYRRENQVNEAVGNEYDPERDYQEPQEKHGCIDPEPVVNLGARAADQEGHHNRDQ